MGGGGFQEGMGTEVLKTFLGPLLPSVKVQHI